MALKKTWVIVADQENTKFYEVDNRDFHMTCIDQLDNDPEERMDGLRQRGAVSRVSRQSNIRSLVNENSLQRRMLRSYVNQIVDYLELGRSLNHYQKLIIVAGPELMGMIKSKLSKSTMRMLQKSLTKDYTRFKQHEVASFLDDDVRESFLSA